MFWVLIGLAVIVYQLEQMRGDAAMREYDRTHPLDAPPDWGGSRDEDPATRTRRLHAHFDNPRALEGWLKLAGSDPGEQERALERWFRLHGEDP